MSRFTRWSVVALLAMACWPVMRSVVPQVLQEDSPAGAQSLPGSTAPPVLPATESAALPPETTPTSMLVVNSLDAALHQKIEAVLDGPAEVHVQAAPLSEVVEFLRDAYNIPILIDKRALDDVGLSPETSVTASLQGISLRSILQLMLSEFELTYAVHDQVLMITTREEAENDLELRLYPVADLALEMRQPVVMDTPRNRYSALVELITSTVAPDTWDEVGGAGTAVAYDPWGFVVVSQTRENHEAVAALLAALCRARQVMASPHADPDAYKPLPVVPETQLAAVRKIEQALDQMTELHFTQTPLEEVVRYLAATHAIPIVIDRRSFDEVGLGTDVPVTFSLKGITLRQALRHMLRELDLTYVVRHEVLKITTPEECECAVSTLIYPVPDFMASSSQAGAARPERPGLAGLTTLIQTAIWPDSWDEVGGQGAVESVEPWGVLIISHTDEMHEQIAALLRTARQAHQSTPAGPIGVVGASGSMGSLPADNQRLALRLYTPPALDFDQLSQAIQGTVAPGTWGSAPNQGAIFPVGNRLLIRQDPAVHTEIAEFLDALRPPPSSPAYGGMGGMGGMSGGTSGGMADD